MTDQERRHMKDVNSLAGALEVTLQLWMTQQEKLYSDAVVPGGLAEFAARTLRLCRREIREDYRLEWQAEWMSLLSGLLRVQ